MKRETFEKLKALGIPFDADFEQLAVKPLDRLKEQQEKETKTLSIKFIRCTADDKNFNLTFEITASNLKLSSAIIYVVENEGFGTEEAVPASRVEISANGKKNVTVLFSKNKEFSETWFEGDLEFITRITCDGLSAESEEFKLKCTGPQKTEECFCKQTQWKANTLQSIVRQLRELEDKHFETQYDEVGNPYFVDDRGKVVKSNDCKLPIKTNCLKVEK